MLECLTKSWKIAYPTLYRDDLVKLEKKRANGIELRAQVSSVLPVLQLPAIEKT